MSNTAAYARMRHLWEDHVKYTALWIVVAVDAGVGNDKSNQVLNKIGFRLAIQNQNAIGDLVAELIKSRGGDAARSTEFGKELATLLTEHISQATKIVGALPQVRGIDRSGSAASFDTAKKLMERVIKNGVLVTNADGSRQLGVMSPRDSLVSQAFYVWYENAAKIASLIAESEFVAVDREGLEKNVRHALFLHLDQTTAEALAYYTRDNAEWIRRIDEATEHILGLSDVLTSIFLGKN